MRLNYTEDEDYPGQFALWQGNCTRSLRSKAGQAALKRLEAALLAMPEKKLIRGKLVDNQAQVCALGALAKAEGVLPQPDADDLDQYDEDLEDGYDEDDSAEFGESVLKFPKLVAWKVVEQNDIQLDTVAELAHGPLPQWGAVYRGEDGQGRGLMRIRPMTPEERYEKMLAWVQAQIKR